MFLNNDDKSSLLPKIYFSTAVWKIIITTKEQNPVTGD